MGKNEILASLAHSGNHNMSESIEIQKQSIRYTKFDAIFD